MKNVFTESGAESYINRVKALTPGTQPQWGKMNVAQMLAHCNVTYEMAYTDKYPKPGAIKKFILKLLVKNAVVSEKPYPKNGRTAPEFLVSDEQDFEKEKERLVAYIQETQELGTSYFEGKESHSFGALTAQEWNNLFAKHLEHHLTQFGV